MSLPRFGLGRYNAVYIDAYRNLSITEVNLNLTQWKKKRKKKKRKAI